MKAHFSEQPLVIEPRAETIQKQVSKESLKHSFSVKVSAPANFAHFASFLVVILWILSICHYIDSIPQFLRN